MIDALPFPLPAEAIFSAPDPRGGELLGLSRQGREIRGYRFGDGPRRVSWIAGCHADEPVGPTLLGRLCGWLGALPADAPLLAAHSFRIVPHANPDGAEVNRTWSDHPLDGAYDLALYLRHAVREPPGEDIEFGFPRTPDDLGARPENRAVAAFLESGGPYALHASLHGMAFAAGPWFLLERDWATRTEALRENLRRRVREAGYRLHDIDRAGEKGFHRIDQGFTSRPDSRAMRGHFEALGDDSMAALFRPSSMEFVRSLGGDPLTLVTEMPLFLTPPPEPGDDLIRPRAVRELAALAPSDPSTIHAKAREIGVRAMPIADQMRFQLAYLEEALAVLDAPPG